VNAWEIVTIVVAVIAIAIAATTFFRVSRALDQLGRGGRTWFDHAEDVAPGERPSEDDRDAPIPKRPIRGWPH
jgi:hypothetical protein